MFLVPIQTREVYLNKLIYQSPALRFQGIMFFSFRPQSACVKNPAKIMVLVKAVLPTKDIAACVLPDSKGKTVKKVNLTAFLKTSKTRL